MQSRRASRMKQAGFLGTVQTGTWNTFLGHDAKATRNALESWYHGTFRLTRQFQSLSKKVKAEMERILAKPPPSPIKRDELDPGTVEVLERWEAIPLIEDSAEWTKAVIRFLSEAILQGRFKEYKSQSLRTKSETLSAARCWLYKGPDGAIRRFQPLQQPFFYKDLAWDSKRKALVTKLVTDPSTNPVNPKVMSGKPPDPETLRIFPVTFGQLIEASPSPLAGAQGIGGHVTEPAASAGATDPQDRAVRTDRGLRVKRERAVDAAAEEISIIDLTDDSTHAKRIRVSSLLNAPNTAPLNTPLAAPVTASPTAPKLEPKIRRLHTIRQWDPLIDGPDDDDAPTQLHSDPKGPTIAASTDDSDDEGYDVDERDLEPSRGVSPERGVLVTYGRSTVPASEGVDCGVPRNAVGPCGLRRARSME